MTMKTVNQVPVLDFSAMIDSAGRYRAQFLEELRDAAHNVGFFQLINFGAAAGQIEQLRAAAQRFFALGTTEKNRISNQESPHYRGYSAVGDELTAGKSDQREQLDFSAERPAILDKTLTDAQAFWHLQGPNQWPTSLPELKESALGWTDLMDQVGARLLTALLVAIGLPEDQFAEAFSGDRAWMAKLAHYVGAEGSKPGQGVGAHADYGFITLLLQDHVGGLQVLPHGQSEWLDVDPIDDALVVNIGEMLEVATNGYLMATIHRVVSPPALVDRYSFPFFFSPRLDAVIEKVELPAELLAQARGVSDDPHNPMLASFGANMLKGFTRAHPKVTAKFHPELS